MGIEYKVTEDGPWQKADTGQKLLGGYVLYPMPDGRGGSVYEPENGYPFFIENGNALECSVIIDGKDTTLYLRGT